MKTTVKEEIVFLLGYLAFVAIILSLVGGATCFFLRDGLIVGTVLFGLGLVGGTIYLVYIRRWVQSDTSAARPILREILFPIFGVVSIVVALTFSWGCWLLLISAMHFLLLLLKAIESQKLIEEVMSAIYK